MYLAHITALSTFGERRAALRSQIPIVVLMVGYTMLSPVSYTHLTLPTIYSV